MLHSFLAVLGGFATMALIVVITTALAAMALVPGGMQGMMSPGAPIPRAYLTVNLLCSAAAAMTGGVVTARIAGHDGLAHGAALAALMVAMSVVSQRQAGAAQPRWYQVTLMTVMPALAIAGAWLGGSGIST